MPYDRAAWLARWKALGEAERVEAAARQAAYDRQRQAARQGSGHPLARPAQTVDAAPIILPSPPPLRQAPPTAPVMTPALLEFERARAAAIARTDAERDERRTKEAAAAMILDAYSAFEPADCRGERPTRRGSDAEERATALILSFIPQQRD